MMPPESKKHGCQSLPTDRLSNLPENVINAILMHLPLRKAVSTSILSKKWRYKWCKLPQLILDYGVWEGTRDAYSLSPSNRFTNIMYHILTLHSGPLTKFSLSISRLKKYPKIDSLIYFLSRKDMQHLVLEFSKWNRYKLPPLFFTFLKLRHLTLQNCVICPPPAFRGFDMLTSLELCVVTISSKSLESLISYSPLLEILVLVISDALDLHVQIKAPNLRSFDFTGCINYISFSNVPLLSRLSLSYEGSFEESEKFDFDKKFQSLPALEHLYLQHESVELLVAGATEVPRRLSSPLNSLKYLYVSVDVLDDLSCALCLIRSSPYLQHLEMEVSFAKWYESDDPVATDEVDASFSDVTLNHLRTVKVGVIIGKTTLEMQLIKLLLAKSPMLVTMVIERNFYDGCEDYESDHEVLAKLKKFPWASPEVEVVISDKY